MRADWFLTHSPKFLSRSAAPVTVDTAGALDALALAITQPAGDGTTHESLRTHVLDYCVHARHEGVTPEQMIVRLKHTLDGSLSIALNDPTAQEARANIISMAINAYYDDKP